MFKLIIVIVIFVIVVNLLTKFVNATSKLKESIEEHGIVPNIIALCIVFGIFYYIYNSLFWKNI